MPHRDAAPSAAALLAAWTFGGCAALLVGCTGRTPPGAPPPVAQVTVALPIQRDVVDHEDFTGRTEAVESVEIRARVTGYLDRILFEEGSEVNKDAPLFVIDPRPFKAEYNRDLAQVAVREANLTYREAELARGKLLVAQKAMSQSNFDEIVAAHGEAGAAVTAAKANTEVSKLNLDFTAIASPIDGRTSKATVTRGNLVRADQTLLTTVVSVDPMYVYFDMDEQTILRVKQNVREGKIKAKETEKVPAMMGLGNEAGFPHEGILDFADNRLDPGTGTIRVRGVFPNPKPATGSRVLLPGLFCRVRVPLGDPYQALLVAERALGSDLGQKYVLVVDDKSEVQYRTVQVGRLDNGLRVILGGLQAGERVIVTGLQRVRPGAKVEAKAVDMIDFSSVRSTEAKPEPKPPAVAETPEKK
jgi:RND family efflux transporter MFP subunit